jgi:hypothetical protein
MSDIVKKTEVKKAFKQELTERAGWTSAPSVRNDSFLYKSEATRSASSNDVPVAFGFTKSSGLVKNAADTVGRKLIGETLLVGRRVMRGRDDRLKKFGELADRMHLRLELYITEVVGGTVLFALESVSGRTLTITSPVPDILAPVNSNRFFELVGIDISVAFPQSPPPIIAPETITRLRAAMTPMKKVSDLRDILLQETIADALNKEES